MPGQHPEGEEAEGAGSAQAELGRSRPLEENAHFAGYVIVGLLGSGAFARVYRARHHTLGHEVALKVFEPAVAPGPSGLARFSREAHVAASVHHPHVVQTRDGGVHEGQPFLVMELLEGRDLEAHLRAERTVEELALIDLTIPIVSALMALHDRGLVHGDLGPGNIFLVGAPQQPLTPKLLDIAITKPHRRLRLSAAARQRLMGSPLYMAPEAMLGHELTPASDQYSLGLILYECVTGVNPFMASSLKESVRLIIAGQRLAVLEQSVAPSPGLAAVIERALSVNPDERFPDLATLGRALLRLADLRTRAIWEFSFQSEPSATTASDAKRAPAKAGTASRRGSFSGVLGVLGWVTAGVVAFSSTRPDPQQGYVLVGPNASTQTQIRPLEPRRAPAAPAALAPCLDPAAASGAVTAEAPAAVPADAAAMNPADMDPLVPAVLEAAAPGAAPAVASGGAAELSLLLSAGGAEALGSTGPAPAAAAAPGGALGALTSPAGESGASAQSAHQPVRGTNNAPIFD